MIRNVVIILRCLNDLKTIARELKALFEDDEDVALLLKINDQLESKYNELLSILPDDFGDPSSFLRHTHFIKYWLKKNNKNSCSHDIIDILNYDIPKVEESLISHLDRPADFDEELSQKISKLIEAGELDSAIRKTFVVLTERLRKTFCPSEKDKDGKDLINHIFGNRSEIDSGFEDSDKLSLRNLLDGLYGFYRNKWAHSDGEPSTAELDAVTGVVNDLLKKFSS
jgi:Protein of unknown function (Hypoth_ymh)